METLILLVLMLGLLRLTNAAIQRKRVALLAEHLRPLRIEPLMGTLMDGYLRALGETDPDRQRQVWGALANAEAEIEAQLQRLTDSVARMPERQARVSRLPVAIPLVEEFLPALCFDLRAALAVHARGVAAVRQRGGDSDRDRAFCMSAELMLMQHTCHWFCKSKLVASARLLAAHKTAYQQVLAAVSDDTRREYLALVQGR